MKKFHEMSIKAKDFRTLAVLAIGVLPWLASACSREVGLTGSSETVPLIVSEDGVSVPAIPAPLPPPDAIDTPEPTTEIIPNVVTDSATVVNPEPSPLPPAASPLPDLVIAPPAVRTFQLTVAKAITKPVTNLYLILDNSPSTAPLHAKLAPAVVSLARKIVDEKLNVNLNLLSTTDIGNVYAPGFSGSFNLEPATFRVNDMFFCSYCAGGKANLFFTNSIIDDGLLGDGIKVNPRRTLDYTYNPVSPLPVFIEQTVQQVTSLFTGGTVSFREDLSDVQANQMITSVIQPNIQNFGTNGARNEAVIGALYRAALNIPQGSNEKHAFAIVTNEDDQTPTNLLMGYRGKLKPTNDGLLRMSQTATWVTYKYCGYETIDGIRGYRCGANSLSGGLKLTRCADPAGPCLPMSVRIDDVKNCTARFLNPANDVEIAINRIHDAMINSIKASGGDWPQPDTFNGQPFSLDCKANLDIADERNLVQVDTSNVPAAQLNNLCNQPSVRNPAKTFLEQYIIDNGNLARDPACLQLPTKPRLVQDGVSERRCATPTCPREGKFGAPEIGTMALQQLTQRVGAKGFTLALIANDGVRDCGQVTDGALTALPAAPLLDQLLLESTGGNVALRNARRGHVCDETYDSVLEGLRGFISTAPQLAYPFSGDAAGSIVVTVVDAQGNPVRQITSQQFRIEGGNIIFNPGTIEVGENIEIKVSPAAPNG